MLECSCGWLGVNLVPNYKEKTSHCPACSKIFLGIKPENAIVVAEDQEELLIKESKILTLVGEIFFPT
jgi:hypothetical protein